MLFIDPDGRYVSSNESYNAVGGQMDKNEKSDDIPHGWVEIDGKFTFSKDVTSQEDAVNKYGKNAKYVGETHSYQSVDGPIDLLEDGTWTLGGIRRLSPGSLSFYLNNSSNSMTATEVMGGAMQSSIGASASGRNFGLTGYGLSKYQVNNLRFNLFGNITLKGTSVMNFSNVLKFSGGSLTFLGVANSWNSDQGVGLKISDTVAGIGSLGKGGFGITSIYYLIKTSSVNFHNMSLKGQQRIIQNMRGHVPSIKN